MRRWILTSLLPLALASCTLKGPLVLVEPSGLQRGGDQNAANTGASPAAASLPTESQSAAPMWDPRNTRATAPPSQAPTAGDLQGLLLPTDFISKAKLISEGGSSLIALISQGSSNTAAQSPIFPNAGAPNLGTLIAFNWSTQAPTDVTFTPPDWLFSRNILGTDSDTPDGEGVDLQLMLLLQQTLSDFQVTSDAGETALQFATAHHLTTTGPIGFVVDANAEPSIPNHMRILLLRNQGGSWCLDGYRYGGGVPVVQYLSMVMTSRTQGRIVYSDGLNDQDGSMRASLSFDLARGVFTWDGWLNFRVHDGPQAYVYKHLVIARTPGGSDDEFSLYQCIHGLSGGSDSETDAMLTHVTQDGRATAIAGREVYGSPGSVFEFFQDRAHQPLKFYYDASAALQSQGSAPTAPNEASLDRSLVPSSAAAIDNFENNLSSFPSTDSLATVQAYGDAHAAALSSGTASSQSGTVPNDTPVAGAP